MSTSIEPPQRNALENWEREFRERIATTDYAPSVFEQAILPYLSGDVLDLGCGLGILALAAAARGCCVVALDASPTAIADLARRARARGLAIEAHTADLRHYVPGAQFDCVVALGLLSALPSSDARGLLARLREAVRPGGIAALTVFADGAPGRDELSRAFARWQVVLSTHQDALAPDGKLRCVYTLVARQSRL
jgi:tellurite methyltransferase